MKLQHDSLAVFCALFLLGSPSGSKAEGPLPDFTFRGVVLHPEDLVYSPNEDLIHPTIV